MRGDCKFVIHFIQMNIAINEKPFDCFSSLIMEYAEECWKGQNASHFQYPIYLVVSFLFATRLNSMTHKRYVDSNRSKARIVLSVTFG